jgi:TolA-binding protein
MEALAIYDKLAAEFPGSMAAKDAAFHRLVSLVAQGDERALGQIEAFLLNSPGDEERAKAELLKAEILFARDQFADAAPLYEKAATERGTEKYRADALYKLAWCRLQEKKYDEAIAALTRFVTLYPRHPQIAVAYAQRALAQLQTNERSGALSDFEAIINRHPTSKEREDAMLQRALLLGNMQRPAEMSAAFERLLAEYPETKSSALANFWIGYTAAENKKFRESLEPLDKARQLDPEKYGERATLRMLLSHYYLKDQAAAGREAKKLGADKTPREVRLWLGQSAVESGDYNTAVEFFAPLAAADPEDRGLQTSLAEAQLRAGRPADARATLEKLLPKMHEPQAKAKTHLLLSETLVALKLGKEAKVQAEEAQRLQPEGRINAQARLANGRALLAQERYDDAARSFMAVALLYDEKDLTPLALLLAEQAYASAGNTAEAAQARQERERRYPDFQPPASS